MHSDKMKFGYLFLLLAVSVVSVVSADRCQTSCTWISWESWGSCSKNCGGGIQIRQRKACCRSDATFAQCMSDCHMRSSDSQDNRCCNTQCNNGGTWTYLDRQNCNGRCSCPRGFTGDCCHTACSYIPNCLQNETECNFLGSRCLKCRSPYISTGWTGTCRPPRCTPPCENNGTCISDGICDCVAGYIGERCSLGGSIDSYLLPTLKAVETAPFQPLSWYDQPSFSEFGRVCYVKIELENAPMETLVTAESFSSRGERFGEFTTGPIDSNGSLNSSLRAACLQIRCPSNSKHGNCPNISVKVAPITKVGSCTIIRRTSHMNITVESHPSSHDVLTVHAELGNNYGPAFGLYVGMGTRENAIFATRQQCLSGTNFNVHEIDASKGVLASYHC